MWKGCRKLDGDVSAAHWKYCQFRVHLFVSVQFYDPVLSVRNSFFPLNCVLRVCSWHASVHFHFLWIELRATTVLRSLIIIAFLSHSLFYLYLSGKKMSTSKPDVEDVCWVAEMHISLYRRSLPIACECCGTITVLIILQIDTRFCNLLSCADHVHILTQDIDRISTWRIAQKNALCSYQTLIPSASQAPQRVYSYHSDTGYLQVWCSAHSAFFSCIISTFVIEDTFGSWARITFMWNFDGHFAMCKLTVMT